MASSNEERETFDKLIVLLEETCDKAIEILGPYTASPAIRHETLENPFHVYDNLWDLLEAARAGRSKFP